jgi:hypothetical protein
VTADPLGELLRWETAGGAWRTLGSRDGEVTIALLRCDGGEQVGRIVSADPELAVYVGCRPSSDAGGADREA